MTTGSQLTTLKAQRQRARQAERTFKRSTILIRYRHGKSGGMDREWAEFAEQAKPGRWALTRVDGGAHYLDFTRKPRKKQEFEQT